MSEAVSAATRRSVERLLAVEPALARIGRLAELQPGLPERTLLHAGPPFADPAELPVPLVNAASVAARGEGWLPASEALSAALAEGRVRLAAAQDHGVVTPLAFVAGPSTWCLEVVDLKDPGRRRLSPLNDGPGPEALRFGALRPAGLEWLRQLASGVGAELARALRGPVPLLPVIAAGLAGGDELHGRLEAAQARVRGFFAGELAPEAEDYLRQANQFVLNAVMAAAALMIGAGAGVAGSGLVVACGGNGASLGYRLGGDGAGEGNGWRCLPASAPVGLRLPGREAAPVLPAIGDSAVIDALGLGAACLRFAPELGRTLEGRIDPAYYTRAAHEPFVASHPALPDASIRLGLDLGRPRRCLGIMLGMVGAGGEGLLGRGVAPWPEPATAALTPPGR